MILILPSDIEDPVFQDVAAVIIVAGVVIPVSGMLDTDFMNENKMNERSQPKLFPDRVSQNNYKFKLKRFPRRRLVFLAFGTIVCIIAYSAGAVFVKINADEADILKGEKIIIPNQYSIFIHNFQGALEMFLPGFGIAVGAYSSFVTGLNVNGFASPHLSHTLLLVVFLKPAGILEIVAYGIAISRSGILSYQLIRDRNRSGSWQKYVIPTAVEVGIVLIILLIAAMLEWQMLIHRQTINIS